MSRARRPAPPARPGLTMVEILITLVVIAMVAGAIFSTLRIGTMRVYRGGDETLATAYAAEIIETIRGAPFGTFKPDERALSPEMIFNEHNIPEGVDIEKYQQRFVLEAKVSPVEGYSPSRLKRVEVTVSWEDRTTGSPKSSVLSTFYTPAQK